MAEGRQSFSAPSENRTLVARLIATNQTGDARLFLHGAFLHVVAYTRQTWALRGTADVAPRLDVALAVTSYGSRWVLLSLGPSPREKHRLGDS